MSRSRRSGEAAGQRGRGARQIEINADAGDLRQTESTCTATADRLELQDALADLRDRVFGLRCAIAGAAIASDADRAGLLRLIEDAADAAREVCARAS